MTSLGLGNKISIFRGDDYIRGINVTDGDGEAIDITGWTLFFSAKDTVEYVDDTDDSVAIITVTISSHTDATAGESTLTIASEVTDTIVPGDYVYDIQRVNGTDIRTLVKGDLEILSDVTRRVA